MGRCDVRAHAVNAPGARRPRTVGHRGASALAPENTLRAIEVAIEHGLDLVEVDVHLSRDGQLVVIHDADLRHATGGAEKVADLPAADLARIDVGDGQGVPLLSDVIEIARGRIGVYVELKGARTGSALGSLARSRDLDGIEIIAGSFEPALVAELREAAPSIPRSVLFQRTGLREMVMVCESVAATYAHPCFRPLDDLVKPLHTAGLAVMSPHTNDPGEAQRFRALGVDVIASDDPRVLAPLRPRDGS